MLKPIEGSFDQCLSHYRKHGSDTSFVKLGELIRWKSPSLRRWYIDAAQPVGEYRVRVGQALMDLGYTIIEYRKMPELLQDAYSALAYGISEIDDIALGFGMTTATYRDVLFATLQGKRGMSEERLALGESFITPLREQIDQRRPRPLRSNRAADPAKAAPPRPDAPTADTPTNRLSAAPPPELMKDHDAVAAALAAMLLSSYPLLQFVNSDNFTPEERKKLRERLGFFGAMNISTELNRLCSEKAREQFAPTEGNAK